MLSEQTAVVTGGASGIGRGISLELARHGADVVVADVREDPRMGGTPTHEQIRAETEAEGTYVECDVAEPADLERAVDAAAEFGGIDTMVNNAAIAQPVDADADEARYDEIMDTNLKGVFFGTRVAGERMAEDGGGSIVNVGSVEGVRAVGERPVYSTTRRGVASISESFAGYFGSEGVRVNTVHPGMFETAMVSDDIPLMDPPVKEAILERTPLGRIGEMAEIGGVVVFLASDLSSYVTGAQITVDGGQCAIF